MSRATQAQPEAVLGGRLSQLRYQLGFGTDLATEAIAGTLPRGQNMPQVPAHGLFVEVVSGTTFTAPRSLNRRVHLYRIRPSAAQRALERMPPTRLLTGPFARDPDPNQMRWSALSIPAQPQDFLDGLLTLCGNGSAREQSGMALHIYLANRSMSDRVFSNADGEMLIVPQLGALTIVTELGVLAVKPGELALIPRGIKFRVELDEARARGFVCENYGVPFRLPELGLIGSTGQANAWDFEVPVAAFEDRDAATELVHKYSGTLWRTVLDHSPFDVVAWRGNHAPCRFDMARFMVLGAAAFDHPEPSLYCALTSPSDGVAGPNAEFMIFPARWIVSENTFRPPGFHRNAVAEFLALISGRHEGKTGEFGPGACSIHNNWAPHGPDVASFEAGRAAALQPQKLTDTLAFMIESRFAFQVTDAALEAPERQRDYIQCWQGFANRFRSTRADR